MKKAAPKLCGAKTRQLNPDGTRRTCRQPGDGAGGRCRYHGGKSLSGPAAGSWKHGHRSKYLPTPAGERYLEALQDKHLMRLRQDVALIEMLITGLGAKLPKKGPPAEKLERRLVNLVDQRRRLIESEHRRLETLQQHVTLAQFLATMRIVAEIIREFVAEPDQRRAVQQRLTQLLITQGRPETVDVEADELAPAS